jgi:RND family efflux transporter MFP subunit
MAATAREAPAQPKAAMTVTVANPGSQALAQTLSATGGLAAWQEAVVGAEVQGLRLVSVPVQVGDVVKLGQLLAEFAAEGPQAEALAARAAVLQAQAAHDNARAEAQRVRALGDSGALSESQKAQIVLQEKLTQAQLEAARAQQINAELRLRHTKLLAPDDGVISARQATVGAVVGAGQELFRLVRQQRLEWRAEVTPAEVGRVQRGQSVSVTAPSGATVQGTVRAVAPTADPQTRNILVYVDLPRHPEFKAGVFARGQFELGQSAALTVPAQAVVTRDGHAHVFVVGADNKVAMQRVKTGRRSGDRVEVVQGLQASQRVAVQGAGFLNDGDTVKVAP